MDCNIRKKDGFKGEKLVIVPVETFKDYVNNSIVRRLYLTDVGYFPKAKGHYRERNDGIEEYIFIYCIDGKGVIEINNSTINIEKNMAICIPPNIKHKYYSDEKKPWSILWIHFKGEDTYKYPIDDLCIIDGFSNNGSSRIIFLFELLFRVLKSNYTLGNFIYITNVLELILSEAYYREKKTTENRQNKQVTTLIRYMYKNINRNLTLQDLSNEFKLSKSYLNLIFQENTGRSPIDFFIDCKIKEACKQLKTTSKYIYEVAELVGYKDQYYFSRIFKKYIGVSPRKYRISEYSVHIKEE